MNRVQRKFVLDALDQEDKLTDWESEFINSLVERDDNYPDRELTDRQNEVLNRIQRKID